MLNSFQNETYMMNVCRINDFDHFLTWFQISDTPCQIQFKVRNLKFVILIPDYISWVYFKYIKMSYI